MFGRRPGLDRLLAGGDLDPTIASAVVSAGRKHLDRSHWEQIEAWLDNANVFQLRKFREQVRSEIEQAEQKAIARRQAEAQASMGTGLGPGIRRTVSEDPELYFRPGGSIGSRREDRIETAQQQARERTLAAQRAAAQSQLAEQAAASSQAKQERDEAADAELLERLHGRP